MNAIIVTLKTLFAPVWELVVSVLENFFVRAIALATELLLELAAKLKAQFRIS